MNFYENYASEAKQYAVFPRDVSLTYTLIGLVGEIGEMLPEMISAFSGEKYDPEHLKDEQGDVWWYIANFCEAADIAFWRVCEENDPTLLGKNEIISTLAAGFGTVCGAVKKSIRDDKGVFAEKRKATTYRGLANIVCAMKAMNPEYKKVMTSNLNKLESRKRRGTIQGDGDNR